MFCCDSRPADQLLPAPGQPALHAHSHPLLSPKPTPGHSDSTSLTAVDQLTKFNQRLADLCPNPSQRHLIDGIVLTKFDTIDDKVG